MNIARSLSLFALPLLLVACAGGAEEGDSVGYTEMSETEAAAQKEAAEADKKMDLARDDAKLEADAPAGPTTSITFAENAHDFGTITDGEVVTHIFKFTNTGDEPLVISRCKGSCGCTVPQCPKDPIAPGAEGEIEVRFNSKGKGAAGGRKNTKTVQVFANTVTGETKITISANVLPAPDAEAGK